MGEPMSNLEGMTSRTIVTPEAELFLVEAGDPKKPTILFLHGFPDDHAVWEKQIEALKENYHVAALDLRGVGRSELKAPILGSFRVERISFDIETVINELVGKKGKVHLVAHDWGSIAAWSAITDSNVQDRVISMTSISGPHLGMAMKWVKESLLSLEPAKMFKAIKQIGSAAHFLLFNLPFIQHSFKRFPKQWSALVSRLGGFSSVEDFTYGESTDSESVIRRFLLPVELYRQNVTPLPSLPKFNGIKIAVQAIVPRGDYFLKPELSECMDPYVGNLKKEFVDGNHWVMRTDAEKINHLISQFVDEQEALAKPKRRTSKPKTAAKAKAETPVKEEAKKPAKAKPAKSTAAKSAAAKKETAAKTEKATTTKAKAGTKKTAAKKPAAKSTKASTSKTTAKKTKKPASAKKPAQAKATKKTSTKKALEEAEA